MSIKNSFEDAVVTYYRAHDAWKEAPEGPAKDQAGKVMRTAHGALLHMTRLFLPQYEKSRAPP